MADLDESTPFFELSCYCFPLHLSINDTSLSKVISMNRLVLLFAYLALSSTCTYAQSPHFFIAGQSMRDIQPDAPPRFGTYGNSTTFGSSSKFSLARGLGRVLARNSENGPSSMSGLGNSPGANAMSRLSVLNAASIYGRHDGNQSMLVPSTAGAFAVTGVTTTYLQGARTNIQSRLPASRSISRNVSTAIAPNANAALRQHASTFEVYPYPTSNSAVTVYPMPGAVN
ncbi:hypothetical protein [Burkholderia sp. A9]|uniref:hypothetical protein n=1 Tax=Burkholderia sp. A9 TaxID=1365108 RepID=UPI00126A2129|nr:hypothetical protein [Burkholderia sp. A9]